MSIEYGRSVPRKEREDFVNAPTKAFLYGEVEGSSASPKNCPDPAINASGIRSRDSYRSDL